MTLQRKLEPEVMDTVEDATQYNDMDHSKVNQQFVDELLAFLGTNESLAARLADDEGELIDVLDVGTGTALIPTTLCDQHSAFRVMAVDMALSMLDLATYNVQASSSYDRIQLDKVDAKDLGYEDDMFDIVMSNSIIHHIHSPDLCVAEMLRVLKPGGAIFIRDLMRPEDMATLESLVQTYAGEETEYSQQLFHQSLHAALTLDEIRRLIITAGGILRALLRLQIAIGLGRRLGRLQVVSCI